MGSVFGRDAREQVSCCSAEEAVGRGHASVRAVAVSVLQEGPMELVA